CARDVAQISRIRTWHTLCCCRITIVLVRNNEPAAMLWSERTWPEIPGALEAASSAAILPVGATEQHGPHLGCGMDWVLADRLCTEVARATGVPMLPALPYGCSLGHSRRWPGTIALDPTTLIRVVKEV